MGEEDAVRRINAEFYAAIESLDIKRMEEVWLKEPYITCAHDSFPLLAGWGPVMTSWDRLFDQTFEIKITLNDIQVRVAGDTAWVVITEHIETRGHEGTSTGTVLATNVFERCGTRWYLVHHHASSVKRSIDESTDQLQ